MARPISKETLEIIREVIDVMLTGKNKAQALGMVGKKYYPNLDEVIVMDRMRKAFEKHGDDIINTYLVQSWLDNTPLTPNQEQVHRYISYLHTVGGKKLPGTKKDFIPNLPRYLDWLREWADRNPNSIKKLRKKNKN